MYIVTGGGSGLGRALAHGLAQRKETVLVVGRHASKLEETARFSKHIQCLTADITTASGRELIYRALEGTATVKGLIHNAGVIDPIAPIAEINLASWRSVMMTNVEAPLFLSQGLLNKLLNGRVMHIGTAAAHFPVVGWAPYCVSKAALHMLTRCWQAESQAVAFATVMPGIVDTAMVGVVRESQHTAPDKLAYIRRLHRENRLLTPETVACFLCWLLLDVDHATYVSKEWDIYDSSHHQHWLVKPHVVPDINE